jgi:hypothetical protein
MTRIGGDPVERRASGERRGVSTPWDSAPREGGKVGGGGTPVLSTEACARSLGISVEATPPPVEGYSERCPRTARQIACRALILQGVVAVAAGVDAHPIIDWFHDQHLWRSVTPLEKAFLKSASHTQEQRNTFGWHQEAEWTLLWVIGKVESLGLPSRTCDTRKLVDEIIPPLGSEIDEFVSSAKVRDPGTLLAEDDRTYNLWCYAQKARRDGELPGDLHWRVLYERRYAFEWLDGMQDWDEVTFDA